MKKTHAFKNKLTTFALYCLSLFLIVLGFIFTIHWFMWTIYVMVIIYMGMMLMGLGGFLMFWLYMNKSNYYNKS